MLRRLILRELRRWESTQNGGRGLHCVTLIPILIVIVIIFIGFLEHPFALLMGKVDHPQHLRSLLRLLLALATRRVVALLLLLLSVAVVHGRALTR